MTHNKDWPEGKAPPEWINPEVHKIRCVATVAGQTAHFQADLIFVKQIPYVVFEWRDCDGNISVPSAVVKLEPRYLHSLPESWAPVRWMYEISLEDPRQLH